MIDSQPHNTKLEFTKRKDEVILGLAEQGINAALFYENPDPSDYISLGNVQNSGKFLFPVVVIFVSILSSYICALR